MARMATVITPRIANHALHYFDSTKGFSGGYFSDSFFALCAHADDATLDRLALGFDAEVSAFRLGKVVGGIHMLQTFATKLSLVSE